YTNQGNIAIYPSTTKLEVGGGYRIHSSGKMYEQIKNNILNAVKQESDDMLNDTLYIESPIGTFSMSELYPCTHEEKQKEPLIFLDMDEDKIRKIIEG